ncbi:helix-turn-helix transcriptional regulator [Nocardia sp. NPDC046763]|uniref:helix-turn-helix domain-containing protein n=1 Tax=Nocardia sp. NPDC046763 TaxID=3155256 RepID=UPI0033D7369C
MHEYRRFVQAELDARGWKQADLARKSGLSRQLISNILRDNRPNLGQMPEEATLEGIAQGFGIPVDVVRTAASRALTGFIDEGQPLRIDLGEVSTDALLAEIHRRIKGTNQALYAPATPLPVRHYLDAKTAVVNTWQDLIEAFRLGEEETDIDVGALFRRLPVEVVTWMERLTELSEYEDHDVDIEIRELVQENARQLPQLAETLRNWIPNHLTIEGHNLFAGPLSDAADRVDLAIPILDSYLSGSRSWDDARSLVADIVHAPPGFKVALAELKQGRLHHPMPAWNPERQLAAFAPDDGDLDKNLDPDWDNLP